MDKPKWAYRLAYYRHLEQAAQRGKVRAEALRCSAEESGGARCTADAQPAHAHRYRIEDLP